ncbi:hypothetical protein [Kribbella sp. NPDC050459]|uniref:hypothetical protein n=1 Tax=Kribbella sp. NPDC050459 TaxID=3155785 RepID=UPI0033C52ED8
MRRVLNSKLAVPLIILALLVIVIIALVIHGHDDPTVARREPSADPTQGTIIPETTQEAPLATWARPATTDPAQYAVAFATALWTYDTAVHTYAQWQAAISAFANPPETSDAGRVARSMLPYPSQWEDLKLHKAQARVRDVTAATTTELEALARDPRAPAGWHGFVVQGIQDGLVDSQKTTMARHVTVGVICHPQCAFWSASNELPQ